LKNVDDIGFKHLTDLSVDLLHSLSNEEGICASRSDESNYRRIFTRDAIMAGLAGLLLGDDVIKASFSRTLENLRYLQESAGQIPSSYLIRKGKASEVSYGTLAPRIDAALWYSIGLGFAIREGIVKRSTFISSIRSVFTLLDGLEYNGRHLLYVPAGGNWADEYVCEGYTLYDQVLRSWALRLLGTVLEEGPWIRKAQEIRDAICVNFWPLKENTDNSLVVNEQIFRSLISEDRRYPVSSFSPLRFLDSFDLAATTVLAVSGTDCDYSDRVLRWIASHFIEDNRLPPAFDPVIDETHSEWEALRRYHLFEFRNEPHAYHNGGIWPIWLGWLAIALGLSKQTESLARLRELIGSRIPANRAYNFSEYFNGLSLEPEGTPWMSYTATGIVFLSYADSIEARRLFDIR
jgi:hypothetical protein